MGHIAARGPAPITNGCEVPFSEKCTRDRGRIVSSAGLRPAGACCMIVRIHPCGLAGFQSAVLPFQVAMVTVTTEEPLNQDFR